MRLFLRSTLTRTSIVALALAGCSTVGCGDDTSGTAPEEDTGVVEETGADTFVPPVDSGEPDTTIEDTTPPADSTVDSTVTETSADASDGGTDTTAVDSGTTETSADSATAETSDDSASADSGSTEASTDSGSADAADAAETAPACTTGTLCSDKSICTAGVCTDCTTDTACSTIASGTLCIGGKCLVAECKPPSATGCATTGSLCCTTSTSAGKCVAPVTGKTTCCSNTECAAAPGGLTKCDLATNTCTCPDPTPGTWYVGTTGNDTSGNGSAACPFKTVTKAITSTVGASAATTIILQKAATGIATYGGTCTGGAPCDASPILVPSTITAGLVIKGAGTAAEVVVTGAGNNVFGVSAPGVGFESMTITPTKTGTANTGGHGIVYDYPTAGTEGVIKDVAITGTLATGAIAGTGTAILLKGAAAPTIGTGVRLTGGFHGIRAEGTSTGKISGGPTTAQTIISNFGGACVYVTSASTTAAPMVMISSTSTTKDVIIRDCGTAGAVVIDTMFAGTGSTIDHTSITKTVGGGIYPGVVLLSKALATVKSTSITGLAADGIDVGSVISGTSIGAKLILAGGVSVTGNLGVTTVGVKIIESGVADIDGLVSSENGSHGLDCNSKQSDPAFGKSVRIRNSAFLKSTAGNGVLIEGICTADLAAAGNVFNTADQANGLSGICMDSTGGTLTVTSGTWKCETPATTASCILGTPSTPAGGAKVNCFAGVDITNRTGSSGVTAGPPQSCCKTYP